MAVAVVCLTLDAPSVRAQRITTTELGADATRIVLDGYAGAVAGTLSGVLANDGDVLHVQAAAATSRFETGHTTFYGTAAATLDLIRATAWRASWSADAGSGAFRGDVAGQYFRTAGRITYTHSLVSAWMLGSIGRVHRGGTTQRGEAGVGIVYGPWTAAATIDRAKIATSVYNDVQARATWHWHRLALDANAGKRFGIRQLDRTLWGTAQATLSVASRIQVVAAGGSELSDPERAVLGAKFFSLGVHLRATHGTRANLTQGVRDQSLSVSALRVSGVQPDGSRIIVVQLDHGDRVDIMGDFTEWDALPMRRTSAHTWTVALPISVGAHRLNIRIDGGEWEVPPGMPALPDDFGGMAGVMAVE
jgi:hypothetical protein